MYTPFVSGRAVAGQPQPPSKLCLSCHDGVTAIDNYGGATGGSITMSGSRKLGTNLKNDHLIGIVYPDSDPYFHDKSSLAPVKLVTVDGEADRIECTSCHDPHLTTNGRFLRVTLTGSQICLTCHNK